MGTESFHYRKPSVSSAPDVQLVGQAWGSPVETVGRANAPGTNIQPAGLFSTAPYTGPDSEGDSGPVRRQTSEAIIRRVADNARIVNKRARCRANGDTCMGIAHLQYKGYCYGHARSLGMVTTKEAEPSTSKS